MATYSRVFNFKPTPSGYSQTWKRRTSVFIPENGLSHKDTKRTPLVTLTKLSVTMTVSPISQKDNERLENVLRLVFTEDNGIVGVPLWFSLQQLSLNASTASTTITTGQGSADEYANPAGGYRDLMINLGDYTYPFFSTVSAFSTGAFTLGSAPTMNFRIGTDVTPIVGMKVQNITKGRGNRYNTSGFSYTLTFEEID